MRLSEYFRDEGHASAMLDVFLQIMGRYVLYSEGRGCISEDNYDVSYIEADESAQETVKFADVAFEKRNNTPDVNPVPEPCDDSTQETEKADVFCLGILMYTLYREVPDLDRAEYLLNAMPDENSSFPLFGRLTAQGGSREEAVICSLITRMTDLNTVTRPCMKDCLAEAAHSLPGSAVIQLVDKSSLTVRDEISLPLDGAVTAWTARDRYIIGGKSYIPYVLNECVSLPFRVYNGKKVKVYIVPERLDHPERWPVKRISGNLSLGIDFGTWTSCVSFVNPNGYTEDIMFGENSYVRTAVAYTDSRTCVFGDEALSAAEKYPEAFADCFKRRIETNELLEYTAVNGERVSEHFFDLIVRFLSYLHGVCADKFGEMLDDANVTLTIPACYDAGMKTAILEAARKAGFDPLLLTEPEAAAIFFNIQNDCGEKTVVLDIGGGTSDICLISCSAAEGSMPKIKSEYVNGIGDFGGIDLTALVAEKMIKERLERQYGLNMYDRESFGASEAYFRENERTIYEEAELVKKALSSTDEVRAEITLYFPDISGYKDISVRCSRKRYEFLAAPMIKKLSGKIKACVAARGIGLGGISDIILTGGASLTAAVRRMAEELFKDTGCTVHFVDYSTVVSRGAAIYSNEKGINANAVQKLSETNYDIGTVAQIPGSNRLLFQRLIDAGTSFSDGSIKVEHKCSLTAEEKEGDYCKLVLYRRPREYHHVQSPFDADGGDTIRMIGALSIPVLPAEFDREKGYVLFTVSLDPQEYISADVHFYNIVTDRRGNRKDLLAGIGRAVFIPLNEDT